MSDLEKRVEALAKEIEERDDFEAQWIPERLRALLAPREEEDALREAVNKRVNDDMRKYL